MTDLTVRDIIRRCMRLTGALDSGREPTADELTDGLFALNSVKRSMFGVLIGPRLSPQSTGANSQQAETGGEYLIPAADFTLTLPANPRSGARVGVADAALNFAVNACTVNPNGRLLEGAAGSLTLIVAGDNRRWWFRGDAGNWVREADYAGDLDAVDFPEAVAVYLPYLLAVAWMAEFDGDLRPDIVQGAAEGRAVFSRQYGRRGANQIDPPIGLAAAP